MLPGKDGEKQTDSAICDVGNVYLAICVCLLIIVAPSAGWLAACLYCIVNHNIMPHEQRRKASGGAAVSLIVILDNNADIWDLNNTSIIFSGFCDCAYTEHCDTRYLPFLMPHLFFMKAQRALEAFSFNKCVPESRTEGTVSPLMFGGLITAAAVALLGTDGTLSGFVDQDQTLTTAAKT